MKKIIICCLCLLLFSCFCGCDLKEVIDEANDQEQNADGTEENAGETEDKYIQMVKNGYMPQYEDITYGTAFNNFFSNPSWKYIKEASGENVVEFQGKCMYNWQEVNVKLRFIVYEDNKTFFLSKDGNVFEKGGLGFDDEPMSIDVANEVVMKAFLEYSEIMYDDEDEDEEDYDDY